MTRRVTVIGAGPAGLSAARELKAAGIEEVVVLERNPEAGGLPRFCGHLGWGVLDFHRLWSGPTYARKLAEAAGGVDLRVNHSVVALREGGAVVVNGPAGTRELHSDAVLITTGIREMPRAARLVSGTRPWGVTSTGAFQEMVYAGAFRPFRRPVVVGTELVSFSALLTARHAGIRPVAMIEAGERITAHRPGDLIARFVLGVPVLTRTSLVAIEGQERVTAVVVRASEGERRIACDGVIMTGRFVPETGMLRTTHIEVDPATGGPSIDSAWRCSDGSFYAAGNVLRPVEHSGRAAMEGRLAARSIVRALRGDGLQGEGLRDAGVRLTPGAGLKYVYPQRLPAVAGRYRLYARVSDRACGTVRLRAGDRILAERGVNILPERRLSLDVQLGELPAGTEITVEIAA